jgi:hypothetical protein
MEITVKVPDELASEARTRGISPEQYVQEIVAHRAGIQIPRVSKFRSPAEIRAWLDTLAQFSDKIPDLPERITREWIYQEHD